MNAPVHYNDDLTEVVIMETSNPGPVGRDTGYRFADPKTNQTIGVIARDGESKAEAIRRVRKNHGL